MTSTAVAAPKKSLVSKFAEKFSIEPDKLMGILKATAFKQKDGEVTNEQMAALLVVADQYGLNPFTREIFAFPDKQNGIVPVVGVDGWSRIVNDHAQSDGFEFRQADKMIDTIKDAQPCPEWMEVIIYRKDRNHPIVVREYLDEVYRKPFTRNDGSTVKGPWQTHTKRFLRHKTFIQGARIAYGFSGIYDEDEAERVVEGQVLSSTTEPVERSAGAALKNALGGAGTGAGKAEGAQNTTAAEQAARTAGGIEGGPAKQPETRVATGDELAEAKAGLLAHKDGETLRLYAEGLPEHVRGHEDFTKAFHARLGELAEAELKAGASGGDGKRAGTPRLRKLYLEKMAKCSDGPTVDVIFDETRGFIWGKEDGEALLKAYQDRKAALGY